MVLIGIKAVSQSILLFSQIDWNTAFQIIVYSFLHIYILNVELKLS